MLSKDMPSPFQKALDKIWRQEALQATAEEAAATTIAETESVDNKQTLVDNKQTSEKTGDGNYVSGSCRKNLHSRKIVLGFQWTEVEKALKR